VAVRPRREPEPEPVYWGFGGKLRPDAWGQPQDRDKKPSEDGDKDKDGGKKGHSGNGRRSETAGSPGAPSVSRLRARWPGLRPAQLPRLRSLGT